MAVPISQSLKVFTYVMKQKIKGVKRYPLVLMLEPLFRCNLECKGCGKIQFPEEVLSKYLTVEQCLNAANECGAPMVSIPGGEPLIHPQIKEIVEGLIEQKRYIYLCTNAILLKRKLHLFKPSKYLTFSVHLDGLKETHDKSVCREGVFEQATEAIKAALAAGFRVTTNTTLFEGSEEPEDVRKFFDYVMELGVEGITISPGYSYEKAPDQEHFFKRKKAKEYFKKIFAQPKSSWVFNHSPLYLEFLAGNIEYQCTPWGNPAYNVFGWQKPCYLMADAGYASSFKELIETTDWDSYGTGRHPKCADCMVSCGYEPTAVIDTFSSVGKLIQAAKAQANNPGKLETVKA